MSRRDPRRQHGFTLLEVIVAIMLMAILTTIVTLELINTNELEDNAAKLKAASRALYDEAAIKDMTLRLAFDFEQSAWWVEAYEGTFLVSGVKRDNVDVDREIEDKKREKERLKAKYGSEAAEEMVHTKEFIQVGGIGFVEPQAFPRNIRFISLDTPQLQEPVSKGKAYAHFFPGGYAEPTILVIADVNNPDDRTDDDYLTLEMEPLTGMLVVHDGKFSREQLERKREDES